MPFVIAKINIPVTKEQERNIKLRLGKAIGLIPGKSEEYLLLGIEDNYSLYLDGDNSKPLVYIEASIFGNEHHIGYEEFTAAATAAFCDILGISPEMVFIKFSDITAWSVGGMYIDRRRIR